MVAWMREKGGEREGEEGMWKNKKRKWEYGDVKDMREIQRGKKDKYLKRGKRMDGVKVHVIACEYSYTPNLFFFIFFIII